MTESTAAAGAIGTSDSRNSSSNAGGKGHYVPTVRPPGSTKEASNNPNSSGRASEGATSTTATAANHLHQQKKRRPRGGKNNNNTRSNSNSNSNKKNTKNTGGQRLKIYYMDDDNNNNFQQMHNACKALRYKVHKPRCDCPKLLRMIENNDSVNEFTTSEDGKMDALVVVPDTKQKYLYLCRETQLDVFAEDPRRAELKLRQEMFPNTTTTNAEEAEATVTTAIDESKFKVSCASCLLKAHEPNGFCLIASSSPDIVDLVRDRSRSQREEKEAFGQSLHPDHAHFVARLPRSSLWNLYRSKTRSQTSQAVDEILAHLSDQDIDAIHDIERFTNGIEMGHHLLSLLTLTDRSNDSWLVLGYDDNKSLMLDLPGGKRHLGETSLEGAVRETEEEMSLVWDASWVVSALQSQKKSDGGNRYFVLHPPQTFLENLTDDQ